MAFWFAALAIPFVVALIMGTGAVAIMDDNGGNIWDNNGNDKNYNDDGWIIGPGPGKLPHISPNDDEFVIPDLPGYVEPDKDDFIFPDVPWIYPNPNPHRDDEFYPPVNMWGYIFVEEIVTPRPPRPPDVPDMRPPSSSFMVYAEAENTQFQYLIVFAGLFTMTLFAFAMVNGKKDAVGS